MQDLFHQQYVHSYGFYLILKFHHFRVHQSVAGGWHSTWMIIDSMNVTRSLLRSKPLKRSNIWFTAGYYITQDGIHGTIVYIYLNECLIHIVFNVGTYRFLKVTWIHHAEKIRSFLPQASVFCTLAKSYMGKQKKTHVTYPSKSKGANVRRSTKSKDLPIRVS